MAERVGTTGKVVVTDLDTSRLEGCDRHPIEALVHDVTADPLDEAAFDIVHARLVLEHLPDRLVVLAKLVRSLRPGGRILIEDFDHSALGHLPPDRLLFVPEDLGPRYQRAYAAARALSAQAGVDLEFGRRLPVHLLDAGLTDVDAEVCNPLVRGGSPRAAYYSLSLRQVRSVALGTGLVTEQDIDTLIEALDSPGSIMQSTPMVAAWGRRA
jgi:SAM-dependent methyltransferase